MMKSTWLSLVFSFLVLSCSSFSDKNDLLSAEKKGWAHVQFDTLTLGFEIESKGAFVASFNGSISLFGLNQTTLEAEGLFGGRPVSMRWFTTSDSLFLRSNRASKGFALHDSLNSSIWIGLFRMGLLHNLAGLTQLSPPDHWKGDVSTWVQYDSVKSNKKQGFNFAIRVQQNPAGNARLELNENPIFPLHREQVVRFPGGEMNVKERFWIK